MIPVRYKKNGGNVTVKISIDAPYSHWNYAFDHTGGGSVTTFKGSSEDPALSPKEREHPLGAPNDLKGKKDTWEFNLANVSDKEQDFTLRIEWIQDEIILKKTWEIRGRLGIEKTESVVDSALLIS